MKKIVFISRGNINSSPTAINFLEAFVSLDFEVYCICSSKEPNFEIKEVKFFEIGFGSGRTPLKKLRDYFSFGKKSAAILKSINASSDTIIWVSKIDTALCLGRRIKNYRSILALMELHDQFPIWKMVTKKLIHFYKHVIFNEINRANIARVWYELAYTPSIIPNKPLYHPRTKNLKIQDKDLFSLIEKLKNEKRIILYQGSLLADRNIQPIVEATREFSKDYVLILMGKDPQNRIQGFKKINPNLIHIPWVSPPNHLQITSWADIGIAFYDFDSLNSLYCAPNKIWEYSGFGIPILGQDLPGLEYTVGRNKAGLCVDINNKKRIISALKEIDENYAAYSENSKNYYSSVDFLDSVETALDKVL